MKATAQPAQPEQQLGPQRRREHPGHQPEVEHEIERKPAEGLHRRAVVAGVRDRFADRGQLDIAQRLIKRWSRHAHPPIVKESRVHCCS
jgi:hypothetical protein